MVASDHTPHSHHVWSINYQFVFDSLFFVIISIWSNFFRILSLCLRIRLCFTIPLMPQPFFRFRFYNILCSAYLKWDFVVSSFICIYMSFSVPLFSIKNNAQYCFYLNGLISSLRTHDKITEFLWQNDKYIFISFLFAYFLFAQARMCAFCWIYCSKNIDTLFVWINLLATTASTLRNVVGTDNMNIWTQPA